MFLFYYIFVVYWSTASVVWPYYKEDANFQNQIQAPTEAQTQSPVQPVVPVQNAILYPNIQNFMWFIPVEFGNKDKSLMFLRAQIYEKCTNQFRVETNHVSQIKS